MPLPNLIIIGAMKCGTTSLHYYLAQHPEIAMSGEKALDFFIEARNWQRGLAWYERQFAKGTTVRGEASPNYTGARHYPGVPERMHGVVPDAKLVFMVRDPIARVVSHWMHSVDAGRERRPLSEGVRHEGYIDRSRYFRQLSEFTRYYPLERIHLIEMEDLAARRRAVLRDLFEFLEVAPDFDSSAFDREKHRSATKRERTAAGRWVAASRLGRAIEALPPSLRRPARGIVYRPLSRPLERPALAPADRAWLADTLRPDVERFRELTGRPFARWGI